MTEITRQQMVDWLDMAIQKHYADTPYMTSETNMLQAIRDALTEKAGDGWQPIETAPKDGVTKALYGCFHDGKWYEQITKRGSGVGGLHVNVPTGFRKYTGATHWMPLPQPPALSAAKDGAG